MTIAQIWARANGGVWNGSAEANPATGVGGLAIPLGPLRAFATGAKCTLTFNFGQDAFTYAVPAGFTGIPAHTGGWTRFDPSTLSGSADLFNVNLGFHSDPAYGACFVADTYDQGSFYWEFTNQNNTFFTVGVGSGIGYDTTTYWGLAAGGLDVSFSASLLSSAGDGFHNIFQIATGTVVSIAVILAPIPAPSMTMGDFTVDQIHQAETATLNMQYSNNGGKNWSIPKMQPMGEGGDFKTNISFRNLGSSRQKLISLYWSSAVHTALLGATVTTETAET